MLIIVETNFRVYAYTRSSEDRALLYIFTEIECVLPNFVVGKITRESMRFAFERNVSSNTVIELLESKAHPKCIGRYHIVPGNVSDQLKLWERQSSDYKELSMWEQEKARADNSARVKAGERDRTASAHRSRPDCDSRRPLCMPSSAASLDLALFAHRFHRKQHSRRRRGMGRSTSAGRSRAQPMRPPSPRRERRTRRRTKPPRRLPAARPLLPQTPPSGFNPPPPPRWSRSSWSASQARLYSSGASN